MTSRFADTIRTHCAPMIPLRRNIEPKLHLLDPIRAVLFDIYGTMLISANDELGSNSGDQRVKSLQETVELLGIRLNCSPAEAMQTLDNMIRRHGSSGSLQSNFQRLGSGSGHAGGSLPEHITKTLLPDRPGANLRTQATIIVANRCISRSDEDDIRYAH